MLRLCLLVILLSHRMRTAHITDPPPFARRMHRLYEKLEKLTVAPDRQSVRSPQEKLYEKLDTLNSLSDDKFELTDEDEELLSAMQEWGKLSAEQMDRVVMQLKEDLQRNKEARENDKSEDYGDGDWNDDDSDYPMDANDDWDSEEPLDSTTKPLLGVNPLAFTKTEPYEDPAMTEVMNAVESIAATKARPRIVDDPNLPSAERAALREAAMMSMRKLLRNGKCLDPQPRWFVVRQLAPATDTMYMPPCVQLHRCAPDSGCCVNEGEVCAPVEGKVVGLPFFLHKANRNMSAVKMQFFNHTKCACISREKLQSSMANRGNRGTLMDFQEEETTVKTARQSDWRAPTEEPALEKDEEVTAPPQMRRCTCPTQFLASMTDTKPCSCVCEWPDVGRRRACQSLARGKEHFSLKDRVCVSTGDCNTPSCEFGAYDRTLGKCPMRRYRRLRFHGRGRYQPEKMVVV